MPAWDRNTKQAPAPAQPPSTQAPDQGAPESLPVPPSTPPPGSGPAFAREGAPVKPKEEHSPYDLVLEAVKDELQASRLLAPGAFDEPSDSDYANVTEVARQQIQAYNSNAPSKGL